jgi:4-aminobutyrate aminotransferase-like enzyme
VRESELLKLDKTYCSYGDTVHYLNPPKIFERCEGTYLYDGDGTPFLDLQMWYSAASFGYKNKRLHKALTAQLDKLPQLACQYLHKEKVLLSAKLAQINEEKFGIKGRVHFNVGGSQSVDDALKLIRNETGRNLVFAFMGGYHGRTLGASAITSSFRYRRRYGHFGDRAHFVPYPYCFRCFYGMKRDSCDLFCVKQFEKLFESEYYTFWDGKAKQSEFVAFFVESVQGTGGYVIPPRGYFPALKKILDERNILLIDDEIQMGFYRTGKFWGIEHFGVSPDIQVFGKALTNGLNPLAGIWAREDLITPEKFPPGSTHSTFSSNTIGTAIGLECLKMMEEEDYESIVNAKGDYFLKRLKELKRKYPKYIGDVDGLGLALRIEICAGDGFSPSKELTDKIFEEGMKGKLSSGGKKYGLVLDVGGYYKNVFTIAPSFTISKKEIDLGIELFEQCMRNAGMRT